MTAIANDLRVLWQLARGLPSQGSHADRLTRFYGPQAADYDRFRERMLHGRDLMIDRLAPQPGDHVVELGAGTGRNAGFLADRLEGLGSLTLVDLCQPLLAIARDRCRNHSNVRVVAADATTYRPDRPVDCVYFSYALSMIPDWKAAVGNALAMLRPGGTLGVVDFQLRKDQGAINRLFWRLWFAHDGVRLTSAYLPFLAGRTVPVNRMEMFGTVPYMGGLAVPYFVYIGRKA